MSDSCEPPRPGEIWRPKRDAGKAAVVLDCRQGGVSYAWLDAGPEDVGVSPLDEWHSEFEFVFEKQDHADATPARRGRLIDDFEAHFRGRAVLELGAHTGGLTRSIGRYARSTTVVENNPRCLPALRAVLPGAVEVVHDDMHRALFRLPPGTFDVIVCAGVLYHSAHPFSLLEGMAYLEPRLVLVDTMNDGVDGARVVPAVMTNSLNYRYNRYPDCGFSVVLGADLIERAMANLGYVASRIRKDDVAIAPEHDSDYFRAWRRGYAAWFRRDA
ncbi:MAG TPA: methyltransferase domain-containing protein [Polyangiaceae bacterium]|nr:methyltransferase domain-containing protein [Polyangiaceae bacterium]